MNNGNMDCRIRKEKWNWQKMYQNVELTKKKNLTELIDRLCKNNMKEAANSIFEMVAYADAMEKNGFGLRGTRDGKGSAL